MVKNLIYLLASFFEILVICHLPTCTRKLFQKLSYDERQVRFLCFPINSVHLSESVVFLLSEYNGATVVKYMRIFFFSLSLSSSND